MSQYNTLRELIREEIVAEMNPQPLYPAHIFERRYVEGVLGIRLPLNESYPYSSNIEKQIIQEHLLLEGFFGDLMQKGKDKLMDAAEGIKKFGKEAWGIMKAMYIVVKGGAKDIKTWTSSVAKKGINKFFNTIKSALEWLIAKLPGWKMPTFAKMAQKALDALNVTQEKVNALEGWKRVIGFSGLAIGLHWLWEKIGDWIDELKEKIGGSFSLGGSANEGARLMEDEDEGAQAKVKDWIAGTLEDKLKDLAQGAFQKVLDKLFSVASGVKPWWDAAVKVAGGVKIIIGALGAAATRFMNRQAPPTDSSQSNNANESVLRECIRALLVETNEYGWDIASRKKLMLDKEGMEKSDRDNVHRYLGDMGLAESFINELLTEQEVKFSGILKVMPDANVIASVLILADQLPETTYVDWIVDENGDSIPQSVKKLSEDRFHVTLAHQSVLKPYRKQLKQLSKDGMLPPAPPVIIEPALKERIDEAEGRKSWVVWIRNQDVLKAYVQKVIKMAGGPPGDPEPSRRFHISIANLTGNPGDSVR